MLADLHTIRTFPDPYYDVMDRGGLENDSDYQIDGLNQAMDNLDYYMYVSFFFCYDTKTKYDVTTNKMVVCNNVKDGIDANNQKFIIMLLYKLVPCVLIQLVVNPINIYYAYYDTNDLCRNEHELLLKLVACVMTLFMTVGSISTIQTELNKYMECIIWFPDYYRNVHKFNKRSRVFVNMMCFFLCLNLYSSILTTIGTVFIIYNSNGVLEIVLNTMALKFIDEIDNISLSKEEETRFTGFYDKIKDDIQTTRLERGYDELKGIREIKRAGFPCALIAMMMCTMVTGWLTFVITIASTTYIGMCY